MFKNTHSLLGKDQILNRSEKFKTDILDSMEEWVRVLDKSGNVVYANKAMSESLGDDQADKKCYEVFGLKEKCRGCISEIMLHTEEIAEKEETIGSRIFSIRSSSVKDDNGESYAIVEMFRDITEERENNQLIVEKNRKIRKDIEFAREIQQKILQSNDEIGGFKVSSYYKPTEYLSGDMYDVFKIDDNYTGFYISDVVGYGITASIMTMFIRQTMQSIVNKYIEPSKALSELHRRFLRLNFDAEIYFTIFYGIMNRKTNILSYTNGGHNATPIVIKKNNELVELQARGYPITSLFKKIDYKECELELEQNDRLILYTDGIIEARNMKGEEYGIERLKKIIEDKKTNILNIVEKDVEMFIGDYGISDDITMLELILI